MFAMGREYATAVLVIATVFFLFTAWSSGTAPETFAGRLGLKVANAGGVVEIRAQYAGFFLAAALVCLASLAGVLPRQASFVVAGTIFGGLIAGRLASLALDGSTTGYGPTILALYGIDALGFGLAVTAFLADR
jgi:hypothetical protein